MLKSGFYIYAEEKVYHLQCKLIFPDRNIYICNEIMSSRNLTVEKESFNKITAALQSLNLAKKCSYK